MRVDDEENWVVCSPLDGDTPLYYPDSVVRECAVCGRKIQQRPHTVALGKPICLICASDKFGPEDEIQISPEVLREVVEWIVVERMTKGGPRH